MQHIKLQHEVVQAHWSEPDARWNVKVNNLETGDLVEDSCYVLISATGVLK